MDRVTRPKAWNFDTMSSNTEMFENRLIVALIACLGGAALTLLTQRLLNKRGLFTYFVSHFPAGLSTDDPVFGTVRVTWNNRSVQNLYLSRVELRNESLNDYEGIVVRVVAYDTALLTEQTGVIGTTRALKWTEEFSQKLSVQQGDSATSSQIQLVHRLREFQIPTMNRGQVVYLRFLNDATLGQMPRIELEVLHKGVRLESRMNQQQFMGVPLPSATLVGLALGTLFLSGVILITDVIWVAASLSFVFGLVVRVPGALAIKTWCWFRDSIGN